MTNDDKVDKPDKPVTWVKRWGYEVSAKPVRPGIYRLRQGGFLVRVMVPDAQGKRIERKKQMPEASLPEAMRARDALELSVRETTVTPSSLPLFSAFATSVLERKLARGLIKSDAGHRKWDSLLEHHLIPAFGRLRLDEITRASVEAWFDGYAEGIKDGKGKPASANTRLSVLQTILSEAVALHGLPANPATGVKPYDVSTHPTYTEEEPNSLTLDETRRFLDHARTDWPQFYAMILLGFVTGQRPSHLEPLRRRGETPDVLWDEGVILIRRSHSTGKDAMRTTKTKLIQRIALADEILEVLRWHERTQLRTPAQEASDLLFPSEVGSMRFTSALTKPFNAIAASMKLKKHISPRAMRRTFQDLTRGAGVHDLVARSISGHQTAQMQQHYSTVAASEQRAASGQVVSLLRHRQAQGLVPVTPYGEDAKVG